MAAKKVEEKKVRTKSEIVKEMQNINDAAFAKRKLLVEERKKTQRLMMTSQRGVLHWAE